MLINKFFYKLYKLKAQNQPVAFLGTGFSISENGGILTCRHVVDVNLEANETLGIWDDELGKYISIKNSQIILPKSMTIDLAFISNALGKVKPEYIPLLSIDKIVIGDDVYTFGFFSVDKNLSQIERGYFSGRIVNISKADQEAKILLPFPVLEGMSGSPILTYHNGPKLVGVAFGNKSSRILAHEVLEYEEKNEKYKETINRIVEFGIAYHSQAVWQFLLENQIGDFKISSEEVQIPNLES